MRVSTNTPVLNHTLTILMGIIVMMKACSGFLTDTVTMESKLSEQRYPQNHHPLSHAMNRNKVSIEPRIVNGIYVNPPDKYSFMGALRIIEPLDELHSTSCRYICIYIYMLYCYTIRLLNVYLMI